MMIFLESVTFNEAKYIPGVFSLWRQQLKPLPDHYQLSLRRLKELLKRLRQTPDVLQEYDDTIQEHIRTGIVEDVPVDNEQTTQVHYLPHHCSHKH